jgi:hypothetical protein
MKVLLSTKSGRPYGFPELYRATYTQVLTTENLKSILLVASQRKGPSYLCESINGPEK